MRYLVVDAALASLVVDGQLAWAGPASELTDVSPDCVVHRFVHAPAECDECAPALPGRLEAEIAELERAGRFERWELPARVASLRAAAAQFPGCRACYVFDTPFFRALPQVARCYALPQDLAIELDLFRRGRHGLVHRRAATAGRCVSVVLDGDVSVAALADGRPVEVSAGVSALEGVPGATTVGDIDPAAILYLVDRVGLSLDQVEQALVREGGLAASPDLLVHRLRRYIGAYSAVLGGLDTLVFSGASPELAGEVAAGLTYLGVTPTLSAWTVATAAAAAADSAGAA